MVGGWEGERNTLECMVEVGVKQFGLYNMVVGGWEGERITLESGLHG